MSKRITQIKAGELDLRHIGKVVELIGQRPSDIGDQSYTGTALRIEHRAEMFEKVWVVMGPAAHPVTISVAVISEARVLDADTEEHRSPTHFGSGS